MIRRRITRQQFYDAVLSRMDALHSSVTCMSAKLDRFVAMTQVKETRMSEQLDRLTGEVRNMTTVATSAVTLINGLAQQIRDAGTNPSALNALAEELAATSATLADAIAANTAASNEPPADQPPVEGPPSEEPNPFGEPA